MRPWLNIFSYDAITSMFWSSPYGFLDKGNDKCPAMVAPGKVKQVHAMDSFHSSFSFQCHVLFPVRYLGQSCKDSPALFSR